MWNAKRILILVIALLAALSSYSVYSFVFGIIDGLRPLPTEYLPSSAEHPAPIRNEQIVDEKLAMAFGAGCKELQRPFKIWLPDKTIAFAAGDINIDKEKDGRVRLAPFSAAIFHQGKSLNGFPEISTIQADCAILTLDQPVSNYGDLNARKVIAVEMVGKPGITITNNRRTAEKNDDVDIFISNGPLLYEERRNMIWSDGVVCLTDYQSKPPTVIRGNGLEMTLARDLGAARPKQPKGAAGNEDIGNIETIKLRSDVQMHFWVDASAGFLGGTPNPKRSPVVADKKPVGKAQIHIRTGGPFNYNLKNEYCWFESPAPREGKPAAGDELGAADQVHIERVQTVDGKESVDQLICDRLDLKFRRKNADAGNQAAATGGDKEIEAAKAIKRGNNFVTLALESEKMDAFGTELFYRCGDAVNGPTTILKGEPLRTSKEGHKMVCKELHLFGANRFGEGQRAWAKGPGQIDMLDAKNLQKEAFPQHLLWQDTLTLVKDKEGGQVFDLMTVMGNASFIDDAAKQELHGDKILVWFLQTRESEKKTEAVGGARQELHRILAQDAVRAVSPEYIIRQTARLTMTFHNEVGRDDRLPDLPSPVVAKKPAEIVPVKTDAPMDVIPPPPLLPPKIEPKQPMDAGQPAIDPKKVAVEEKKKPDPPIELQANEVTVAIASLAQKKQLQELVAKGNVFVFQPGDKPGEKRIDIVGQLLTVRGAERGHVLVVWGDKDKLARVEVGDTILHGPTVTFNQSTNQAEIDGHGAMDMPSNKNLDGTDSKKKNSRITIHWNKNMTFNGQIAMFYGGVQAWEHDSYSRMKCETLQVILDKRVSFLEGQKQKENAKIDRFICHGSVYVFDWKEDEKKQPLQGTILQGQTLHHMDECTRLVGIGEVRHLAKGSGDVALGAPAQAKPEPGKTEWKLTHVKFRENMLAKTKDKVKTADFYGLNSGVEVFHFPTTKLDGEMNADRPLKDQMYLRCDHLHVRGEEKDNRTSQTMIARTNVMFKTDQYHGYADIVKYDEATDVLILEGLNGNNVRLFQVVGERLEPAAIRSTKVRYDRKTGKIDTEGVKSITN